VKVLHHVGELEDVEGGDDVANDLPIGVRDAEDVFGARTFGVVDPREEPLVP
jgi:hypothetical protein